MSAVAVMTAVNMVYRATDRLNYWTANDSAFAAGDGQSLTNLADGHSVLWTLLFHRGVFYLVERAFSLGAELV